VIFGGVGHPSRGSLTALKAQVRACLTKESHIGYRYVL